MAVLTKNFQVIAIGETQYFGGVPAHLELQARYDSQNIETNKTFYVVDLWLVVERSYIGQYQTTPYSINVTGTPSSKNGDAGSRDYTTGYIDGIVSEVEHNADGTKTITASASMNFTAWGQTLTVSGEADLPTIPRASSLTATDCYIESATTITINRASSSFKHTITYSFGSSSPVTGTIATKTDNTSIGWTVPSTFYAKIPNANSGVCTLTCQTYSGDTLIGTKTSTFTVTVNPTTNSPTISASVIDTYSTTTDLTGDNTKLIKYYSTAQITYSATAKNSASISNVSINGVTVSSSPYSIPYITTNTFNVVATDTRGYSTVQTLTPTMIDYIPLTINASFYRTAPTTGEVSLTFNGNYFNSSFGSQSNTLQLKWYYKLKSESNWTLGGTLVENTDYVISGNTFHSGTHSFEDDIIIGNNFDYRNAYDFKIEYFDKLVSMINIQSISKGIPIVNWDAEHFNVNGIITQNEQELDFVNVVETKYLGENPNINILKNKSGVYGVYNCTQTPTTDIGVLEVLCYSNDWVIQRFTNIGSTSNMWTRCYYNGTTWSSWTQRW